MKSLEILDAESWGSVHSDEQQNRAIQSLESGKILYFPHLPFHLHQDELAYLKPEIVDPKSKNISYDLNKDQLGGTICKGNQALGLKEMLKRYAIYSSQFLESLIPHYKLTLAKGKTSFRPVEIAGRRSSVRKDDTLLHVDSFPSNPTTDGKRILRVFTNVNPDGQPRIWRVGEPFNQVVDKMINKISPPFPGSAALLHALKITKNRRSLYDHYMLNIHHKMKEDVDYQKTVDQEEITFPPGSTWVVFTDQVSHAAISGKDVFEQTFYIPVKGIKDQSTNPLVILENTLRKKLV